MNHKIKFLNERHGAVIVIRKTSGATMTFNKMTHGIMTLNVTKILETLSFNDPQTNNTHHLVLLCRESSFYCNAECRYAEHH
jgi:hypothetical protein